MLKKILLITLLGSLFVSLSYAQSAWNKKQGSGFIKLNETIIYSDDFYSREGQVVNIRTTGVYITSIYGEYGITDRLTGYLYFPFFFRNTRNGLRQQNSGINEPGESLNSIGDSNIGLSLGLLQGGSFVLNTSLTLGLPLGQNSGGNSGLLQTGDGEFNQLLKVNAGYSFRNAPIFFSGAVGFNNRTNNFSDELHLSFEGGVTFSQKLTGILKLYNITSFENGSTEPTQTGIFSNDLEYFSIGPEISYKLNKQWNVTAAFFGAASGRNILASPSYSLGVSYGF